MAPKYAAAICVWAFSLAWPAGAQESPLRQAARLDTEHKCGEAEQFYQQALAQGAPSPALLNNLGNHYLLCGEPEKAGTYFERLLQLNPQHGNANLQLARLAVERHQGARALEYLARINDSQPPTRMLYAEALHWAGKQTAALAALDAAWKESAADPRLAYLYGMTCARIGAYDRAETAFNAVLAQYPEDFEILFNLGRAAARAGHYDRARHALEVAAKLRPDDVDSLMELGEVNAALADYPRAIYVLAQAKRLAPARPEISLALARVAQSGEFYGDAALAYDEYLQLKPGDDSARRDRALVCGFTDARKAEGLKELTAYVAKHPTDPLGHYDLAQLTWGDHPDDALNELNAALRLNPRLAAAHVDAGWLLNRMGRTEEALPHFQKAVALSPKDARALDQLGSAYVALDRPAEGEKVLRQALAVSPDDPEILMHLGRALLELGREAEARPYLDKFQKIRPPRARGPWRQPGMIESASLPPAERSRREIARLRQDASAHPDDPELQLRLASLLLAEGRTTDAVSEFRVLLARNADNRVSQQAGVFLLGFEQYGLAREFLERAAATNAAANLDLATAVFYLDGPAQALSTLDRVPESERSGDYLLLKAKILDAAGRNNEAEEVLRRGLQLSINRPQIAREAALLLVRNHRNQEALEFLTRTAHDNPDLLLTRAIILGLMERANEAGKALEQIEGQWPEWDRPYLVQALLIERTAPREAQHKLQTAVALGSQDPAARCEAARLSAAVGKNAACTCASGLYQLLFPDCAHP